MSKKPSDKTELRHAKREIRLLTAEHADARKLCAEYRSRATKAEQELAEWKNRFDLLLSRKPEQGATP